MKAGWWDTTLVLRDLAEAIPIISGDGLALLTKNIFQTTYPFSLDHLVYVYWYLGYLSGRPFIKTPPPSPPRYYLELRPRLVVLRLVLHRKTPIWYLADAERNVE